MENASKALIMAGGVLVGILLLTLAVSLFHQGGGAAASVADKIKDQQIAQFNRQFDKFISSDNGVTIYDVVTVAGLARNYNKDEGYLNKDENGFIKVRLYGYSVNASGTITPYTDDVHRDMGKSMLLSLPDLNNDSKVDSTDDDLYRNLTELLFSKERENLEKSMGGATARNEADAKKVGYLKIYKCIQEKLEYKGADERISNIEFEVKTDIDNNKYL